MNENKELGCKITNQEVIGDTTPVEVVEEKPVEIIDEPAHNEEDILNEFDIKLPEFDEITITPEDMIRSIQSIDDCPLSGLDTNDGILLLDLYHKFNEDDFVFDYDTNLNDKLKDGFNKIIDQTKKESKGKLDKDQDKKVTEFIVESFIREAYNNATLDKSNTLMKEAMDTAFAKIDDDNIIESYAESNYGKFINKLKMAISELKEKNKDTKDIERLLYYIKDTKDFNIIKEFFENSTSSIYNTNKSLKRLKKFEDDINGALGVHGLKAADLDILKNACFIAAEETNNNLTAASVYAIICRALSCIVNIRDNATISYVYYMILNLLGAIKSRGTDNQTEFSKEVFSNFIELYKFINNKITLKVNLTDIEGK